MTANAYVTDCHWLGLQMAWWLVSVYKFSGMFAAMILYLAPIHHPRHNCSWHGSWQPLVTQRYMKYFLAHPSTGNRHNIIVTNNPDSGYKSVA